MVPASNDENEAKRGGFLSLRHHQGRLDCLDALRGVAALLVVLEHVLMRAAYHPLADKGVAKFLLDLCLIYVDPGRMGVVSFFLVSGFVIPFSFRGKMPRAHFLVSRFFRLYPAYWLSLAMALLVFSLIKLDTYPPKQILANITMLQFGLRQADVIPAYWTLFIELAFYGLCFVAFSFGVLGRTRFLIGMVLLFLSLALIGAIGRHYTGSNAVPVGYMRFLGIMFFGAILRKASLDEDPLAQRAVLPLLGIGFVMGLATFYLGTRSDESIQGNTSGEAFGVMLFFLMVYIRPLSSKFMTFLGQISYSAYLMHAIFMYLFAYIFFNFGFVFGDIMMIVLTFAFTILAGWLCFNFVERPSVQYGRTVAKWLEQRLEPRGTSRP